MAKRTLLIIGSGGREHALAWALARSPLAGSLYIAPGNPGTAEVGINVPVAAEDVEGLARFAREKRVDLTIVGPEAPLAAGMVDHFQAAGLPIFGPTQAAARLESSKVFAKRFMRDHNIPTAGFAAFSDYDEARAYLDHHPGPCVVKADGLAAGKGVIVCKNQTEAHGALQKIMQARAFGTAGDAVVIEECLSGPEVSLLAFSDGRNVVTMPPARDHKRIYDGDQGPNTGGMGAYAPAPDVDEALVETIRETVLQRAVDGMARLGMPYVGVLYAGIMLTPNGPQTLEFNCRFGDPETQAILPLLETDLVEIFAACIENRLHEIDVRWRPGACASVVLAAPGYPNSYPKGLPITGIGAAQALEDIAVFHAGTAANNGQLLTDGGRVLAVSAVGGDLEAALRRAYQGVACIDFEGMHYRRDIGKKA